MSAPAAPRFGARNFSTYRCRLVREAPPAELPEWVTEEPCRGPADAARIVWALTSDSPQEEFWVLILNTRHRIVAAVMVTRGILDASLIHPREVFRPAILASAAGIILAHNHPSGDPEPSAEDRAVTRQLSAAGQTIGIPVLDHIVVGDGPARFRSCGEELAR